jgi:hypothetical protein
MKTCEELSELLPVLAEDCLGPAEAEEVRAHIASCASCAESWKVQELITRHFRETELDDRPDYFWTRQRKHILDQVGLGTSRIEKAAPAPRRRVIPFLIPAAAAAAVVIGVFTIVSKNEPHKHDEGLVRQPEKVEPVVPPVANHEATPEVPDAPPQEEFVEQPEPEKPADPAPAPKNDSVVQEPESKPDAPKTPPKDDVAKEPPPGPKDTTPKDPAKPPASTPPAPEVVAILPGHPHYPMRLAKEQTDIVAPIDPVTKSPVVKDTYTVEQALAVLMSARGRLDDIRDLLAKDPKADVTELVDAYAILVGEGASRILYGIRGPHGKARLELKAQKETLASFPEELRKGALRPAVLACAAAEELKRRVHRTKSRDSEVVLAARESVALLSELSPSSGNNVVIRTRWGFAVSNRYVTSILEHAKAGRLANVQAEYKGYQDLVGAVVDMLGSLDPRDAARACSPAKTDLTSFATRFARFPGPEPVKRDMDAAAQWTTTMVALVVQYEGSFTKWLPRPPKKEPAPPPPPPPPPAPPAKDPPPPFGEPAPPPPPAPKGEGFEEPK